MITVEVTQQDIERGRPGTCGECPVALALKRRGFTHVDVNEDWISVDYRYSRSGSDVVWFIDNFYNGRPIFPQTFELEGLIREGQ